MKKLQLILLCLIGFEAATITPAVQAYTFTVASGRCVNRRHTRQSYGFNTMLYVGALAGGAFALYKAGCALYNWYAQRYTLPRLIEEATVAIRANRKALDSLNTLATRLQNIKEYGSAAEADLEYLAMTSSGAESLYDHDAARTAALINQLQDWYTSNRLNSTQINVLNELTATHHELVALSDLAKQAVGKHASYFKAYAVLNETHAYLQHFITKYGVDYDALVQHITAANLRLNLGYRVEDDHYLVSIAQRVQKSAQALKMAIGLAVHYKKLHQEYLAALNYLEALEECITELPQFQLHVQAYKQYEYQQEQLRLERERVDAEKRAAKAAEEQACAARNQVWQMHNQNQELQEQNRIQRERNRIEKERNQRERNAYNQ